MSDLGAGGDLHQQLTDALRQAFADFYSGGAAAYCEEGHAYGLEGWVIGRVSPVFDDLVAAAQAARAERIAEAIEAHQDQDYPGARTYLTVRSAAAYARAVGVPETEKP